MTEAKKPAAKTTEPKSILVRLKGPGQELHLIGTKTAKGWRTAVQLRKVEDMKTLLISRGASADHPGIAQARKAIDGHVARATKDGWKRIRSAAGFAAEPDAFQANALPRPEPQTER